MQLEEIKALLDRQPLVPLRMRLTDGTTLGIPFRIAVVLMKSWVIVFKGVKYEGSKQSTGYERVMYDQIAALEPKRGGRGRKNWRGGGSKAA